MSYASDMIRETIAAGPYEGEDFHRIRATGEQSTKNFNATPLQLAALALIMEDPSPFGRQYRARDLPPGAVCRVGLASDYVRCRNIDDLMRWEQPIPGSGDWVVTYVSQLPEGVWMTDAELAEVREHTPDFKPNWTEITS